MRSNIVMLCLNISLILYASIFTAQEIKATPVDDSLLFLSYLQISIATMADLHHDKTSVKFKIEESIRGDMPKPYMFTPATDVMKHVTTKDKLPELIGKRFIIFSNGPTVIEVYPYSKEAEQYIDRNMPSEGMDDLILLVLFLVIIAITLLPQRISAKLNPKVLLLAQIIAYAFYEWGTPGYYNIRADLLFIIPAIVFNWIRVITHLNKQKEAVE